MTDNDEFGLHDCTNPFCIHDPVKAACEHEWRWVDEQDGLGGCKYCPKCGAEDDEPGTFAPCIADEFFAVTELEEARAEIERLREALARAEGQAGSSFVSDLVDAQMKRRDEAGSS